MIGGLKCGLVALVAIPIVGGALYALGEAAYWSCVVLVGLAERMV